MNEDLVAAYAHCERIATEHYENFTVGSRLMPRSERRHLAALYAFARGADDIADEPDFEGDRLEALDAWEAQLDAALSGAASGPVFRAVAQTVRERELSDEPLRALLRAFRYDACFEPFADFEGLRRYCRDSANPVGRLVLGLFGVRDPKSESLSDDVCTGLQLANFWQDLSIDLAAGRSYLPTTELDAHAGARDAIARRRSTPGFEDLLGLQIERARYLLSAGEELAARVPRRAALEIRMFAGGGLRIVDRIESLGGQVLTERPKLTRSDFAALLASSLRRTFLGRAGTAGARPARAEDARSKGMA